MVKINPLLIENNNEFIFYNVSKKVKEIKKQYPNQEFLSLGVGDVSKPIVAPIIKAMHEAVDDLSKMDTFKGYGASYGYNFLKEKILENEYSKFAFTLDEIYISNGTKTDSTNILELFAPNVKICIPDIMYPIYKDGAACLNHQVYTLKSNEKNDFLPQIPKKKYDIIYICSPNNPTGICYKKSELRKWVDYALKNQAIILYDNVYASFIESKNVPKSIYEIKDADKVAIEFRSFSKNASFTGVRCSYYIIPNKITSNINEIWKKRTINRFNGADYIAQKGAAAVYTKEAMKEIKKNIIYYKENAKLLRECFQKLNFKIYGGIDSPFIWVKIKENLSSWEYFNFLLEKLKIVVIPGIIFGNSGDKYFRVSALAPREIIIKSIERLAKYYEKQNI